MAKKTPPPKKVKMAPKSVAKKTAPKKVAPLAASAKTASGKKGAASKAAPATKASLKSEPKKDVKLTATKNAGAKSMAQPAVKKGVELKVKAGAAPAPVAPAKPLTKPQKVAKVKKAAAPKNYENMCREVACDSSSSTAGYCRLHYIKNWKKIKRKELILREKKLNQYIEELVSKYPDKYIEAIKQDLADETAFSKVIYDLELDEGVDDIPVEDDADEQVIDSIKREFDDGDTDF
jgi:nucleoid-associated protein YgaU